MRLLFISAHPGIPEGRRSTFSGVREHHLTGASRAGVGFSGNYTWAMSSAKTTEPGFRNGPVATGTPGFRERRSCRTTRPGRAVSAVCPTRPSDCGPVQAAVEEFRFRW